MDDVMYATIYELKYLKNTSVIFKNLVNKGKISKFWSLNDMKKLPVDNSSERESKDSKSYR